MASPFIEPRTECACQPVACMMAAIVATLVDDVDHGTGPVEDDVRGVSRLQPRRRGRPTLAWQRPAIKCRRCIVDLSTGLGTFSRPARKQTGSGAASRGCVRATSNPA
jgi:hypothetical protein